jgi:hypothetical protein
MKAEKPKQFLPSNSSYLVTAQFAFDKHKFSIRDLGGEHTENAVCNPSYSGAKYMCKQKPV